MINVRFQTVPIYYSTGCCTRLKCDNFFALIDNCHDQLIITNSEENLTNSEEAKDIDLRTRTLH